MTATTRRATAGGNPKTSPPGTPEDTVTSETVMTTVTDGHAASYRLRVAEGTQINDAGTLHPAGAMFTTSNPRAAFWLHAGWVDEVVDDDAPPLDVHAAVAEINAR